MIQLTNVSKVYRTRAGEVRAMDDVTFEVPAGQFVAVRGHSGSGKSTLLALVGGLAVPSSGEVRVADRLVSAMSPAERAAFRAEKLGFVFQMFHLLPYVNVLENVLVGSTLQDRQAARERAGELLRQFGLEARLTHRPSQLSVGAAAGGHGAGPVERAAVAPGGRTDRKSRPGQRRHAARSCRAVPPRRRNRVAGDA